MRGRDIYGQMPGLVSAGNDDAGWGQIIPALATDQYAATLARWCEQLGWEALVNKRGTTWRKLPPERQEFSTQIAAVYLMVEFPSLIRRPVVETDSGQLLVGFDPTLYASVPFSAGKSE